MKIAYVYDAVYPWVKGGAEKRIYELSRRLAARGHEVHCYGMKWWPGAVEMQREGVHLHGICPPMPLYRNGKRSIAEAAFFAGNLLALRSRCDVMDCQNFPYLSCFSAKLVSSLHGERLFLTWHEVWGDYWREYLGGLGRAGQAAEWAAAHLTARNIVVSKRTERDLSGLGARDIQIVPNGIDWREIRRVPASEQQSDIIYVGRLAGHKNVDQLIRAVGIVKQQLSEVRALIIGDGPEMGMLKSLVSSLNLEENVRFLGFIEDYNEALALMKSSQVFVMPSTREGFGLAALEANACGLPVVTVKHRMNAVADLVSEKTGVVCSPTAKDLSDAILLAHQKSTMMRGQCMEAARRYDWDEICRLAERVYDGKASIC